MRLDSTRRSFCSYRSLWFAPLIALAAGPFAALAFPAAAAAQQDKPPEVKPADPAAPAPAAPTPAAPAPAAPAPGTPAPDTAAPGATPEAKPEGKSETIAPEPALVPLGQELSFKYGIPKRIVVTVQGDLYPKAYWYMTYTVTNNGDKAYTYFPQFEMLTDDGKLVRADRAVPRAVFDAIKRREGNKLLEPARKMGELPGIEGDIQPGEDQARDGVAIWPEVLRRMGTFSIFCGGLSEEAIEKSKVRDDQLEKLTAINAQLAKQSLPPLPPVWWREVGSHDPRGPISQPITDKEGNSIILRKQLQLTFKVPGDEIRPGDDEVLEVSKRWVMR